MAPPPSNHIDGFMINIFQPMEVGGGWGGGAKNGLNFNQVVRRAVSTHNSPPVRMITTQTLKKH